MGKTLLCRYAVLGSFISTTSTFGLLSSSSASSTFTVHKTNNKLCIAHWAYPFMAANDEGIMHDPKERIREGTGVTDQGS